MNGEVDVELAGLLRQTDHLPGATREAGIAGEGRRMGQRCGIDVQKTVERAAVKTIKPPREGLFGLEADPLSGSDGLLPFGIGDRLLHLLAQCLETIGGQPVLDRDHTIPLQVADLNRSQQSSPAAQGLRQLNPAAMQSPVVVQQRTAHPGVPEALGARQQGEHGPETRPTPFGRRQTDQLP